MDKRKVLPTIDPNVLAECGYHGPRARQAEVDAAVRLWMKRRRISARDLHRMERETIGGMSHALGLDDPLGSRARRNILAAWREQHP